MIFAAAFYLAAPEPIMDAVTVGSGVRTEVLMDECAKHQGANFDPCSGYILGILDEMSLQGSACPPEGFTTLQAVAIVRNYLAANPATWNRHPTILVRSALQAAFPCHRPAARR